jgi:hypothetical protein
VASDPALLEEYVVAAKNKRFPNVRSLMIADYFRFPEILSMKVKESTEQSGTVVLETIVVDYMSVKTVTVSLIDPDGSVPETGAAILGIDKQTWTYGIQNAENLVAGVQFEITATDLPGNVTTKSFDYQA